MLVTLATFCAKIESRSASSAGLPYTWRRVDLLHIFLFFLFWFMSNSHFSLPCHGQPWTCSTGPGNHTKMVVYMPMMIVIAILIMKINYDETTWSRVVAEAAAMQERTPRKTRILSLRIELFIQLILSIFIIIIIIIARGPSSIIIIVIIFTSETCAHLSEEEKPLILRNQRCKDKNAWWKCCSEILMFT